MTVASTPGIDELLSRNARDAQGRGTDLPRGAALAVAILTCMDSRLDVHLALGVRPGEAHIIRNAGASATEDTIRSLSISQSRLGTREVLVMGHSDCAMAGLPSELGGFDDTDQAVLETVRRLRGETALPHRSAIRGFVLDLETLQLREVGAEDVSPPR